MFNIGFYHIFVTFIMTFQVITAMVFALAGLPGHLGLILGGAVYFALPVFIFIKASGQKYVNVLEFKRLSPKNLLYVIALSVSVYPMALVLSAVTAMFFTNHIPEVVGEMAVQVNPLIMFFAMGLSPAIFEEILLRGMLGKPLKHLGTKGALLNGLYFGLIHLNPHQFFYAFALGVLLYYILVLTGSIWAPILSHLIINSLALVLFFIAPMPEESGETALYFFLLPTAAFIFLLPKFIRDNKDKLDIVNGQKNKDYRIITPSFIIMLAVYVFIIFSFSLF